jgi:hypothetical protein
MLVESENKTNTANKTRGSGTNSVVGSVAGGPGASSASGYSGDSGDSGDSGRGKKGYVKSNEPNEPNEPNKSNEPNEPNEPSVLNVTPKRESGSDIVEGLNNRYNNMSLKRSQQQLPQEPSASCTSAGRKSVIELVLPRQDNQSDNLSDNLKRILVSVPEDIVVNLRMGCMDYVRGIGRESNVNITFTEDFVEGSLTALSWTSGTSKRVIIFEGWEWRSLETALTGFKKLVEMRVEMRGSTAANNDNDNNMLNENNLNNRAYYRKKGGGKGF